MSRDWRIVVKCDGKAIGLLNTMPVVGLTVVPLSSSSFLAYENEVAATEAAVGFVVEGPELLSGAELVPVALTDMPHLVVHPSAKLAHKLTSGGGNMVAVVKNLTKVNVQMKAAGDVADKKHQEFMDKHKDPV